MAAMTVEEALKQATCTLKERCGAEALAESELLLRDILRLTRTSLFTENRRNLRRRECSCFFQAVAQRAAGVPPQYITGKKQFRFLDLSVRNGVFIPRPETELLVEYIVEEAKDAKEPFFLDVGTGCGAIALSLAFEVPGAAGIGVDVARAALRTARENARAHQLSDRVSFLKSDVFQALSRMPGREFDVIVSNPPYVRSEQIKVLGTEVKVHEPREALDGGGDGLDVIRRIVRSSPPFLRKGGLLALEVGFDQASCVEQLVAASQNLSVTDVIADYAGIERIVVANRV